MKIIKPRKNGTKRVYTENKLHSKTDQSFKKECDVNNIVKQYAKTGQITHLARTQGVFADLSNVDDLLSSYDDIKQAESAFLKVPAELRKKLHNDPNNLISYLQDPKNDLEAIQYGLKDKRELPTDPSKIVPPPTEPIPPTEPPKTKE